LQHLVANWHVDRNRTGEWEPILGELNLIAARSPGFRETRMLRSVEHPGKYTVYSLWDSRVDWEAYYADERVQELFRATFRLIKGPPVQEWFDLVGDVSPVR